MPNGVADFTASASLVTDTTATIDWSVIANGDSNIEILYSDGVNDTTLVTGISSDSSGSEAIAGLTPETEYTLYGLSTNGFQTPSSEAIIGTFITEATGAE